LKTLKNMKIQKRVNNFIFFTLFCFLFACTTEEKRSTEWEYPPVNPYPTVMNEGKCKDGPPCIIVELDPKSLKFDCTLRNDSPYYWCGIDGQIKNPDPKLPKIVGTVFHRIVDKKGKKTSKELVNRLKKADKPVFLVAPTGYYIKSNEFGNAIFGIYNEDECMNLFYDFSSCPESAKKLDLYKGNYIP